MSHHGLLGKLFAVAVALGCVGLASDADSRPRRRGKPAAEPAKLEAAPALRPKKLRFGMKPKQVYGVYDAVIEKDYLNRYREVEPGIQLQRLKHEIAGKKQLLWRDRVTFDEKPTKYDGSELAGEFTRNNQESMMTLERKGKRRYLFYIRGGLWKVIDVYPLAEKGKWGPSFKTAVAKIEKMLGVEGRSLPANDDREFAEVDWADGNIHLRVANWGKKVAIAYVDQRTEQNLPNLRTTKAQEDKTDLDPSVKDVIR